MSIKTPWCFVRRLLTIVIDWWRHHEKIRTSRTGTVSHHRDRIWIAAKRLYVILDPLQRGHLIQQTEIAGWNVAAVGLEEPLRKYGVKYEHRCYPVTTRTRTRTPECTVKFSV